MVYSHHSLLQSTVQCQTANIPVVCLLQSKIPAPGFWKVVIKSFLNSFLEIVNENWSKLLRHSAFTVIFYIIRTSWSGTAEHRSGWAHGTQWQPGPQADMLNQIYFCWLLTWLLAASQCCCCQGSIEIIWANLSTSAADLPALLWWGRLQWEGDDKQTHSSKPLPSEIRTFDCGSEMSWLCRTASTLSAEPFWRKDLLCSSSPASFCLCLDFSSPEQHKCCSRARCKKQMAYYNTECLKKPQTSKPNTHATPNKRKPRDFISLATLSAAFAFRASTFNNGNYSLDLYWLYTTAAKAFHRLFPVQKLTADLPSPQAQYS